MFSKFVKTQVITENKEKVRLQSEQKKKRKGFLHDSSTFPMTA